jgi:hypothetical protein
MRKRRTGTMHDAGKITAGLAVFLAIVTLPLWYHSVKGAESSGPPELKIAADSKQCVAETSYMRSRHMNLLNEWRQEVVRDGDRMMVGIDGETYEKNLAVTCIFACHSNREEFCDRCHGYVGVEPFCWDCHAEQKGNH